MLMSVFEIRQVNPSGFDFRRETNKLTHRRKTVFAEPRFGGARLLTNGSRGNSSRECSGRAPAAFSNPGYRVS
jgi:hypothetical protein